MEGEEKGRKDLFWVIVTRQELFYTIRLSNVVCCSMCTANEACGASFYVPGNCTLANATGLIGVDGSAPDAITAMISMNLTQGRFIFCKVKRVLLSFYNIYSRLCIPVECMGNMLSDLRRRNSRAQHDNHACSEWRLGLHKNWCRDSRVQHPVLPPKLSMESLGVVVWMF